MALLAPIRFWAVLRSRWETLRESYWLLPLALMLAGACVALALVELDRLAKPDQVQSLPWVLDTGPAGARAVLSTVAGSMATVTGVVFSITIVALTLASAQFGPRLLRNFMRDRGNQLVLGTFLSTFLYALLVLRVVQGPDGDIFVPHLATAGGVVLAVVSLFVLIYFVHHVASSIQAQTVIASVAHEIELQLPELFPEELGGEDPHAGMASALRRRLAQDGAPLPADAGGYVRVIDQDALMALAREHDLELLLEASPGTYVGPGDPLLRVVPVERASDAVLAGLGDCIAVGAHRTPVQDLSFLTDQLVEMAVRALSPGVNDPGTAVACVQRLGSVIGALGPRAMPGAARTDADGRVRVVVAEAPSFDGFVGGFLDAIRTHGAADASVALAILEALRRAAARCPDAERRTVLRRQAEATRAAFEAAGPVPTPDRERVARAFAHTAEALADG